jgi:hypothetical protein
MLEHRPGRPRHGFGCGYAARCLLWCCVWARARHGSDPDGSGQVGHASSTSPSRERDAPAPAGGTPTLQNAAALHYVLEIKWVSYGQRKSCKNLYR